VWEDPIEKVPSWSEDRAAFAGAILPSQRAFLMIGPAPYSGLAVITCQEVCAMGSVAVGARRWAPRRHNTTETTDASGNGGPS
jgi:hypothetical protein